MGARRARSSPARAMDHIGRSIWHRRAEVASSRRWCSTRTKPGRSRSHPTGARSSAVGKDAVAGRVVRRPDGDPSPARRPGDRREGDVGHRVLRPIPTASPSVTTHGTGGVWRWHLARSGAHVLPSPVIEERRIPASAAHEQREYSEAMDLIESYSGNPAPLHEAQARLLRLLDDNPRSGPALAGLGRIALKQALDRRRQVRPRRSSARRPSTTPIGAIASQPDFADGYIVRGFAARRAGRADGLAARTALNTALKLAPTSTRALSLAVALDIGDGDWDAAERALVAMLSGSINHRLAAGAFEDLAHVLRTHRRPRRRRLCNRRRQIDLEPDSAWAKGDYAQFLGGEETGPATSSGSRRRSPSSRTGSRSRTLAEAYCATGEQLLWERSATPRVRSARSRARPGSTRVPLARRTDSARAASSTPAARSKASQSSSRRGPGT